MDDPLFILETERLILRRLIDADIEPLIRIWIDPDVTRYMGGPRELEQLQASLAATAADPFTDEYDLWPVIEKSSGSVVGHSGLLDKEVAGIEEIELVYVIAQGSWGRGFATEVARGLLRHAFERLQLGRVIALIEPQNEPSEQVAVKAGLILEKEVLRPGGHLRKVYSIDKPTWGLGNLGPPSQTQRSAQKDADIRD